MENKGIYKFLSGLLWGIQGHPHGIFWRLHVPTICLRCCYLMFYVPAISLWFCKLLSFGRIWVINFVFLYDNRYRYRHRADFCLIGRQSVSVELSVFSDCVKPIFEKIPTLKIIYIVRWYTLPWVDASSFMYLFNWPIVFAED